MAARSGQRGYWVTWAVLLGLTALTFGLAHVDLGHFNEVAAFAIALTKATLIGLVFMHLAHEEFTLRFILVGAALVLLLLVSVVLLDARSRAPLATPPQSARNL
jgi:cytochrome c oxidase subunit 4